MGGICQLFGFIPDLGKDGFDAVVCESLSFASAVLFRTRPSN